MKPDLDAIDRKILAELQADGRMTNVELARRVGISAPPCLRRVRALEEAGYITGYRALLDAPRLGFAVTAFVEIRLKSQSEADLLAFERTVQAWPYVREAHMLSGEYDFLLKCIAPDLGAFQTFIMREVTAAPNVANSKTTLAMRVSKADALVPLEIGAA